MKKTERGLLPVLREQILQLREELSHEYDNGTDDDDDDIDDMVEDVTPPMDAGEIKNLETTVIDQKIFNKISDCTICLDEFKIQEEVNILYCEHFFHSNCIKNWLVMHASCPLCRKYQRM